MEEKKGRVKGNVERARLKRTVELKVFRLNDPKNMKLFFSNRKS